MNRSIGVYCTHIAVALYLFAEGILGISGKKLGGLVGRNDLESVLLQILKRGDLSNALVIVLSVAAIVAGIFLILELFQVQVPITDIILLVFLIIWALFILLKDIIGPIQSNKDFSFIPWAKATGVHLMILGALISASHKFGN
ncbi:hypothetical protein AGMMS50268_14790 [Spirochaetia bacterium]|nr:hypothetical protein AGMMS50268_14790 [Spirochaetia bacterium]